MELIKPQIIGIQETPEKIKVTWGQVVGRILNRNAADRLNSDDNWKKDEDMKLVGRIPRSIYMLWKEAGILDDEKELDKALERHPEYKTTEKRLI
jgi:hypothetical protein